MAEVRWLREEHHIVGDLLGGLPQAPQQNVYFGLPLLLSHEELDLLISRKAVELVELQDKETKDSELKRSMCEEYVAIQNRMRDFHQRSIELRCQKNPGKIFEPKPPAWAGRADIETQIEDLEGQSRFRYTKLIPLLNKSPCQPTIQTHTTLPFEITKSIETKQQSDTILLALYARFSEKLRNRKFVHPELNPPPTQDLDTPFFTTASKFGASYAIYPGDPARFHSLALIYFIPNNHKFRMLDLVKWARVGHGARKATWLVTEDENLYSMCWAG